VMRGRYAVGCGANCLNLQGHRASCGACAFVRLSRWTKRVLSKTKSELSLTHLFRRFCRYTHGDADRWCWATAAEQIRLLYLV
jgi:hypothetical protein